MFQPLRRHPQALKMHRIKMTTETSVM